MFKIGGVI